MAIEDPRLLASRTVLIESVALLPIVSPLRPETFPTSDRQPKRQHGASPAT